MPLLLVIDAASLKPYWRLWDAKESWLLLLGAFPGVTLGIIFWRIADQDALRLLIGSIAVGFVILQLARRTRAGRKRRLGPGYGILAGCGSAFATFVSHAGGPVAAVYLLSKDMSKTRYQATTVLVFAVLNVVKDVAYTFLGAITPQTLLAGAYLVPAAFFGTWLGVVAHRAIPERVFFNVTYALLLATGSKLIFDALT